MREYELMHVTAPNNVNIIDQHSYVDLSSPTPPPVSSPPLPTTVVFIREKRPFLHRLSHSLTITRLLGYKNGEVGPGSRVRQDPDMKLKQRWILFIFILLCVLLVVFLSSVKLGRQFDKASQHLGITLNLEELTDRHKCPACFGVNLCPAIFNDEIQLNSWNKFTMSQIINVKNVFDATWRNERGIERQIVLKKLAHNEALAQLDKSICDRQHGTDHCDVSDSVTDLIEKYKLKLDSNRAEDKGVILNGHLISDGSDVLLCPSHRKMDFLLGAAKKNLKGQHHDTILANVLTMMLLNPEPLLLQAFPQRSGWPFPAYYGACGRIIAEEYVGRRLTTYVNEPFGIRASLAKQLLEMATKFGNNPSNFILYMTDVSGDNFAVDDRTHEVRAIDLENFIVVDKESLVNSTIPNGTVTDKLLESQSVLCDQEQHNDGHPHRCFSFSTQELCSRRHTDHNFYAVCAGLLAEGALSPEFSAGLLHTPPSEFRSNPKFKTFQDVLLKCKDPSLGNPNWHYTRIEAAEELVHQLDIYLKSLEKKNQEEI